MSKRDYYEVLSVESNASEANIKKAYRRLAMKHHPDRNQGDAKAEENFKEAKEAYEVLSDQQKRAAYDQFGHAGVDSSAGGGGRGAGGFSDVFEDVFGDIFGGAAGGRAGQSRAHRGSDLRYEMELSLEDAVHGKTETIRVPTHVACKPCSGSGAKKGSSPKKCTTCAGLGQVRIQQGFFSVQQACPHCHGNGSVISDPCTSCNGQGRVRDTRTLSVKIPAGVDTGDRIRLSGEGEAGENGGPTGDLYVQIRVKKHPLFTREGTNLYCEIPVSFVTAALGGEIEVPTLEGRVNLKVPAESQTAKVMRLKGKGVRSVHESGIGDLFCKIMVETPVNLSSKQKKLLREFDETTKDKHEKHNPKSSSWIGGVKKFLDGLHL